MRRAIDILVASLSLVALAPLLVLVAGAICLESPGGPLYFGRRAGQGGRPFAIWKFRTMRSDRAIQLGSPITGANDRRVTRMGRLLRASKIDELPQFFNVLRGEMTLVGPRPEALDLVAHYTPRQRQVLHAKPGITGPVQLQVGDEAASIPAGVDAAQYYREHLMAPKIEADLSYLSQRSFASDTAVVFATAGYVLRALLSR